MQPHSPILAFSHLRWDFVYQRPQHLLLCLATRRRIVIIEEPLPSQNGECHWVFNTPLDNVLVCRPHTPVQSPGFADEQLPCLRGLFQQLVIQENLNGAVAWFYTPMALPLADELNPQAVVYDCMDELSAFLNAPPQLLEREAALLHMADVVFTGGPSLYRAKKDRHPQRPLLPEQRRCGAISPALRTAWPEAEDQSRLPASALRFLRRHRRAPRSRLLDAMARAHPDWQIVLVGPVVKIDPATLPPPSEPPLHGQRRTQQLPAYLAGWDVCLLPFARNEATRFISPTKTLEYMAAGSPIVSTPITDVAEPYGEIVYLGDDAGRFVAACERALAPHPRRRARAASARRCAKSSPRTSWDATAAAHGAI